MRQIMLFDRQRHALIAMYDAGAVSRETARDFAGLRSVRAQRDIKRLCDHGLACRVQSSYCGVLVYWLSERGIERAKAEKAQAAA